MAVAHDRADPTPLLRFRSNVYLSDHAMPDYIPSWLATRRKANIPLGTPRLRSAGNLPDDLEVMTEYPSTYEPITTTFGDAQTRLDVWQPRASRSSIPTPKTRFVYIDDSGDGMPYWDTDEVADAVEAVGGEAFVRTMYKSAQQLDAGSHLYATDREHIDMTLTELMAQSTMARVPHGSGIAVREWLPPAETAYGGASYRHPEVRFFIDHGKFKYYMPRMSEMAFDSRDAPVGAYDAAMNAIQDDLSHLLTLASEVADLYEHTAVAADFIKSEDTWYLTDMATDGIYKHQRPDTRRETWKTLAAQNEKHPLALRDGKTPEDTVPSQ